MTVKFYNKKYNATMTFEKVDTIEFYNDFLVMTGLYMVSKMYNLCNIESLSITSY